MTKSEKGYTEVNSRVDNAAIEGNKYVCGHFFEGIGSGENANLYLQNPSDSGVALVTDPPTITAGKRTDTRLDFNPTVDTAGTDAGIKNRRTDISDTSEANGHFGGAYTLSDPFDDIPIGGETGSNNTYAATDEDKAFGVAPGDSVLLQATATNADTDIRLAINFAQVPATVFE